MMPVSQVTVSDFLSILITLFMRLVSRTMPPKTGSAPPWLPEPPPHVVTGILYWLAILRICATSSALPGCTTKSGFFVGMPRSCHISGIQ